MLTLNTIHSPKGATKKRKRIGRGQGSGQGTQAGKGHKGQKARSGGGVRTGFEGGQMPIYRRLPKKGFNNSAFRNDYAVINLEKLEASFEGNEVSKETLVEQRFIKGAQKNLPIKILAKGEITKALNFKGIQKFSKSAEQAITKAGGQILAN